MLKNFQLKRKQEGRTGLFLAVLRKRQGLLPVSQLLFSVSQPPAPWKVRVGGTTPTWPGLPCPLAWKAQGSVGPGSLLGVYEL